jgi:hypothetical protein
MDQRKLDRQYELELGHKATVLMDELTPYFDAMNAQLIAGIKQCPIADTETLHIIKLQMHALDRLRLNMQSVIDTGKLAKAELEQNNDRH